MPPRRPCWSVGAGGARATAAGAPGEAAGLDTAADVAAEDGSHRSLFDGGAEAPGRGPEFGASAAVDVDVAAAAFGCSVGCGELRVTTTTGTSWVGFGGGCCVGRPQLLTAAADSASAAASSVASCSSTLMKEICLPAIDLTSRAV